MIASLRHFLSWMVNAATYKTGTNFVYQGCSPAASGLKNSCNPGYTGGGELASTPGWYTQRVNIVPRQTANCNDLPSKLLPYQHSVLDNLSLGRINNVVVTLDLCGNWQDYYNAN